MKSIIRAAFVVVILLSACASPQANTPTPPPTYTEPAGQGGTEPVGTAATQGATSTQPQGTSTPEAVDLNCNILWSRLRVGDMAYVTWGDRPNRVRSEPKKDSGNVIGEIYPGIQVKVEQGPVCADGLFFWKVSHSSIPGGSGWTAEGKGRDEHWLGPVNCASNETALYLHHYAYVDENVKGLRVFDKQGSDGQVIDYINGGTNLKLVGGPFCTSNDADKLVYWKVENLENASASGWVAEYGFENGEYTRYLRYSPGYDVYAFSSSTALEGLTPAPAAAPTFKLSDLADLGKIAFVTDDWTWLVNADGTNPTSLKNPLGKFATPTYISWSPDGSQLVMTLAKKMFKLSADGQEASELLDGKGYITPVWSPDGKNIAFSSYAAGFSEIDVISSNGADLHRVSQANTWCGNPAWSPYGKYIAYICYDYGSHIKITAFDTPGTTTLDATADSLAWSPDGFHIAYNDSEEGLSLVEATGANARVLVSEGSGFYRWSPDSKSIAFINGDQVYVVNIIDQKIRNLTGHVVKTSYDFVRGSLSWSPDSKYLVYEFQSYSNALGYWKSNPVLVTEAASGSTVQLLDQGTYPVWSPVETSQVKQLADCTANWSRLKAGGQAKVMGLPTDPPNRVRSGAGKSFETISQIYPGAILDLIEGPVCADGMVFWKVKNASIPGGIGWTAEGDGTDYWLEPYKP